MKPGFAVFCSVAFALCAVGQGRARTPADKPLGVGDKAPPLSIAEWVKGAPVDLARDAKNKIHVVEFWAVWCAPCEVSVPLLTQMQKRFKNDVVIVGVTEPDAGANSPSAIRRFVQEKGKEMDYTVAIDTGRTTRDYLAAAGAIGIPHAFVVGKDGRIVWQGSPLDSALEDVVTKLVAGTFDVQTAKIQEEVNRRLDQIDFWVGLEQWRRVHDGLVEILKLDPAHEFAVMALRQIAVEELQDAEGFRAWARAHIDGHRNNRKAMQALSSALWSTGDFSSRFPDLAFEAARAAFEAGETRDASTVSIYARALYHVGHLDQAIAVQQDAVALAGDDELRKEARSVLEYYRLCKKLYETVK